MVYENDLELGEKVVIIGVIVFFELLICLLLSLKLLLFIVFSVSGCCVLFGWFRNCLVFLLMILEKFVWSLELVVFFVLFVMVCRFGSVRLMVVFLRLRCLSSGFVIVLICNVILVIMIVFFVELLLFVYGLL